MQKLIIASVIIVMVLFLAISAYWLFVGTGMSFNKGRFCIQTLQSARNPISGVTKEFSDPCSVPIGWQKTNSFEVY